MTTNNLNEYKVWDLPVRVFHWVNFLSVISLIFLGLIMLYKKELGITSIEAKIGLKEVHIIIGYIFSINLLWRIIWGFIGNKHAQWKYIFPDKGFVKTLREYAGAATDNRPQYLGHNPLGRIAVLFIIILLCILMLSGLIRAGTDIYYPPFGSYVAEYIAVPGVNSSEIIPYNPAGTDADKARQLKTFKKPFGTVHLYSAYILMLMIVLHVFFVIRAEVRDGGGLISAMFTGKKILKGGKPVD